MGSLDGDVYEGEDAGVVEEVGNGAELIEHVRRIGHTDLNSISLTRIMIRLWCCNYSHKDTKS